MASAIKEAAAALCEKKSDAPDEKIDISNLKDGIYELPIALWNATQDKASMAAPSFSGAARVVVKNGRLTVYVYTKPMTFGSITASLQEMKVEQSNGTWVDAAVETKSSDGNPTCFSFSLDKLIRYVNVKVNPHVEMMGNQDLDARLKFDLSSIKIISENASEKPLNSPTDSDNPSIPQTGSDNHSIPQTSDESDIALWLFLMIASAGIFVAWGFQQKRKGIFNR